MTRIRSDTIEASGKELPDSPAKRSFVEEVVSHPAFAYLSILALQLKVMWEFWLGRDLTPGDTAGYFTMARAWATSMKAALFWSPLYTAFYGTVYRVAEDVVNATIAHRVLTVFAVIALVLALARKLLPPAVAWIVAAWWAILPINFDTWYEVHLFGAIPPLTAALLLARKSTSWTRASAVAILLTASVLVRNEIIVGAALFTVICLWYELRKSKDAGRLLSRIRVFRPYLLALLVSAALIWFFHYRSFFQGPTLAYMFDQRQKVNFCQAYAFNYKQRHPEWPNNPFTQCEPLIAATFGSRQVTFGEAVRRNPEAIAGYLALNLKLLPNGVQLALFNETSGETNPDYVEANLDRNRALLFSIVVVLILLSGGYAIRKDVAYWRDWVVSRAWPVAALACASAGVVVVMLQQRARPSYMFVFTFSIMACVGLGLAAVVRRLHAERPLSELVILLFATLILLAPPYYAGKDRPLADIYRRMEPFASGIAAGTVGAVPGYGADVCNYLLPFGQNCVLLEYWSALRPEARSSGSLSEVLEQQRVELIYADAGMLADPIAQPLFENPEQVGWNRVDGQDGRWLVLHRAATRSKGSS